MPSVQKPAVLVPAARGEGNQKLVFTAEQDLAARELERVVREQQQFINAGPHEAFFSQTVNSNDPNGNKNTDSVYAAIGQPTGLTVMIKDGNDWQPWSGYWEGQKKLLLWNLDNKFTAILLQQVHQVPLATALEPIKIPYAHGTGQSEAYDRIVAAVKPAVTRLNQALMAGPRKETV